MAGPSRVFLAVAAAAAVLCAEAAAQTYLILKFDRAAKNDNASTVRGVLKGQLDLSGNEAAVNAYFASAFAEMTQLESLGKISAMRDSLLRSIRSTSGADVLQHVNRLTMAAMRKLCTENFHPATRYNAALIIGLLDSRLSTGYGPSAEPPVPYAAALPVLLEYLGTAELPDAVKVAAMLGVMRHARYGLPDDRRAEAIGLLVGMLEQEQPPGERTDEGHTWLRRRAADVLGVIGESGSQDEILAALSGTVTNRKAPISLRCSAAQALGRLKIDPAKQQPADPLLIQRLGELALDALDRELETARKRLNRQNEPAWGREEETVGASIFSEGAGPGAQPAAAIPVFPRRRLAYQMACVHAGLSVVGTMADEKSRPLAEQLLGSVTEVRNIVERKDQTDQQLVQQVGTVRGKLGDSIAQMQTASQQDDGRQDQSAPAADSGGPSREISRVVRQ